MYFGKSVVYGFTVIIKRFIHGRVGPEGDNRPLKMNNDPEGLSPRVFFISGPIITFWHNNDVYSCL
jgi:hypothetical protein